MQCLRNEVAAYGAGRTVEARRCRLVVARQHRECPANAAIEACAKALGTNPNLVTLVQAERWNGVLPTTMVPGSSVPFVSVK